MAFGLAIRKNGCSRDVVSSGPPAASGEGSRPNLNQEYEGTLKSISSLPALSAARVSGLSGYSKNIWWEKIQWSLEGDVERESSQVTRMDMASLRVTKRR